MLFSLKTCLLYTIYITIVYGQIETKIVNLKQGPVRGYKKEKENVFVFRGIPYATEPKGADKYKAPLPPPTWTETFDARTTNVCPQYSALFPYPIPENCLVANIYVPNTNVTNLSVFVYIHGGGFYVGSGDDVQPTPLVESKKIVAVSINYRLGVHGFLCLGTESAPGNAGMKDQNAALRWVKENIASFGGNPNDITIGGSSAGSTSVNLHMLSKMSQGLFQKVIAESASDLAVFATQPDPLEIAKIFAKNIDSTIEVNDFGALEEFYLKTPVTEFIKLESITFEDYSIYFVPCVESEISIERFLESSPYSIIKSGDYTKVPKLEGIANMEGLLKVNEFDEYYPEMNKDFSKFLPGNLQFESKEQKDEVAKTVKQFYFGNREIGPNTAIEFFEYFSDTGFAFPMLRSIKLHLESGLDNIYLYEYAFVDEFSDPIPHTNEKGAGHSIQTLAIYDIPLFSFLTLSPEFYEMSKTMRELWVNFIVSGQPVPRSLDTSNISSWPKVTTFNSPYMQLNVTSYLKTAFLQKRFELWDKIYDKHYREPLPPGNGANSDNRLVLGLLCSNIIIMIARL